MRAIARNPMGVIVDASIAQEIIRQAEIALVPATASIPAAIPASVPASEPLKKRPRNTSRVAARPQS